VTLVYLAAAWGAGVLLASGSDAGSRGWLALAAACLALAVILRRDRSARLILACLALFGFGAARCAWALRPLPSDHIAHRADTGYVTLTGLIVAPPDVRDSHVNLRVAVERARQHGLDQAARGTALVQAPRDGDYAYGDRVRVEGALITPPEFDDFSYRDYLARRGVHALMPNARVALLARDQGRPWLAALYELRARALRRVDRLLPSPQAPLLSGIVLGDDSALDAEVRAAFSRTGTSHIIAISGANVVVVLRALMGLLAPLGVRRARWLSIAGVALYAVFVGGDATVVRAAIMGGLAVLAAQTGRRAHGLTALAFTVWAMSLINPQVMWDVGFQLSVAATLGLILFAEPVTRALRGLLERLLPREAARRAAGWLTEPVAVTLAAQITTTPLIVLVFGQLSLITLAANFLILPAQPYIMLGGWLTLIAGSLSAALGELLAWAVWLPLTWTLTVVRALAEVRWAALPVELSARTIGIYYAALVAVAWLRVQHPDDRAALWRWARRRVTPLALGGTAAVVGALIWAQALTQPDGKLHVWFLDVGGGHAVLIQTPRGAQILVDGGDSPTRLRRAVGDALPFWDRSLDMVIATQPKRATLGALPDLLRHYDARLLLGGQAALAMVPAGRGAQVQPIAAGWRVVTGDGVTVEALHPALAAGPNADPEDTALVLRVTFGASSFLLAPDMSEEGVRELLGAAPYVGSAVLELPGDGARPANPDAFLAAVSPQAAVVNLEAGSRSALPHPDTLAWLRAGATPLFRTDQQGTVQMITDGRTLTIRTAR